ncbi:mitotic spindle checkpoint protein BUBR1 [Ricinus communis]|uniref:Bubr1, putative n=1 Tax=Ricinus communis TaxID=3988 RepID=B9R8U9_RICCO|nr:mitotic spindle checkpoint protein BUBR1 [Ricinus communis]EEF52929.1 bubr1, putative [Ricinus communis]|eukprot:XP_002510742.1 mitotic spindle checkpoint protein BUBR1 [Ricinus communis]
MEDFQMDPETQFLASKQETGYEWELFKENVRPLKRGRNIRLLNDSLKSHTDNQLKKSLLETRRKLIEAIHEYKGDDPLSPWLGCIKWVQQSFPPGGDCSGLIVIYEQCVRTFWDSDRYKDDLRYLKVWLEYAENCIDAEVIYNFLDANEIGKSHSAYYIAYALHMEARSKIKAANDIFNLGISRDAQPIEKLKDAYKKFFIRSMSRPKVVEEDTGENDLPARSFGTVLSSAQNRRQNTGDYDIHRNKSKPDRAQRSALSIYKDTNSDVLPGHQPGKSKTDFNTWQNLGARAERNKENNAIPTKWTTYKVPQRPGPRAGATASACIEVFVDEECVESDRSHGEGGGKSSTLQLRDGVDMKKETELLRENPLRNFPSNSLPR